MYYITIDIVLIADTVIPECHIYVQSHYRPHNVAFIVFLIFFLKTMAIVSLKLTVFSCPFSIKGQGFPRILAIVSLGTGGLLYLRQRPSLSFRCHILP